MIKTGTMVEVPVLLPTTRVGSTNPRVGFSFGREVTDETGYKLATLLPSVG